MQLQRLVIRGVLAFEHVDINWSQLPAGLVAVVGQNGSGKSTLMDATMASLYRTMPSRARSIYDYAHGPDSLIEATWGDHRCKTRIELNAAQRTQRAFVQLDGSREPLTDGKADSFDEWIARHFPPLRLVLATIFAAQNGRGSFRTLSRTERKDLFAKLLGLERYERLAGVARESADAMKKAADTLDANAGVLQPEIDERDAKKGLVTTLQEVIGTHEQSVEEVDLLVENCRKAVDDLSAEKQKLDAQLEEHRAAIEDLQRAKRRHQDAQERESRAFRRNLEAAQTHDRQKERRTNRILELEKRAKKRHPNDGRPVQVESIRLEMENTRKALVTADGDYQAAVQRITDAQDAMLLRQVPCEGEGEYAGCKFLEKAEQARQRAGHLTPTRAKEAARDIHTRKTELGKAVDRLEDRLHGAIKLAAQCEAFYAEQRTTKEELAAERATEKIIAEQWAKTVQEAQDEAKVLAAQLDEAKADHARAAEKVESLKDVGEKAVAADQALGEKRNELTVAERQRTSHQESLEAARRRHAVAVKDVERIEKLIVQQAEFVRQRDEKERIRDDMNVLARAFGRTGIPVLEIDAAGPHVSEQTNALLRASFGDRFSVRLETQTAKTSGAGKKETFDLSVWDQETGGRRELTDLSGGEQVIVDECLKAALALHMGASSGINLDMCWRDETTGALDGENIDRYVQMLRALQKLGGFRQVVFVTHSPEAAALADARLVVGGGEVEIR